MNTFIKWVLIVACIGAGIYAGGMFLYKKQSFKVFTHEETFPVNVYFLDGAKDPNRKVCDHVIAFPRTVKTSKIGTPLRTLQLLLAGPTREEIAQGAYSAIPSTASLLHFEITDDITNVVIDYDFRRAKKCEKQMIETQIQTTLFQFDQVPEVKINPTQLISG